jgi:hypothetical protein
MHVCEFFTELNKNGHYELVQATGVRPQDYRLAYRKGYATMGSSEILLRVSVTTTDAFKSVIIAGTNGVIL